MGRITKVLWFSNTPSLAQDTLGKPTVGEGWVKSLEQQVRKRDHIELAVAFGYGREKINKFIEEGATYYAIPDRRSRAGVFIGRHLSRTNDAQFIESCLEIIEDFKPDIINVFGTEKSFGLISERTNIPVVVHLQGLLSLYKKKYFPPGYGRVSLLRSSRITSLLRAESLLHHYYSFKAAAKRELRIFKMNRYFMGRTDWDRRATSTLSPGAEYFTGNEILRSQFYSAFWQARERKTHTFLSTIQANMYKGLETVLESAQILKKNGELQFKWIIAGIPVEHPLVRLFERKAGYRFSDVDVLLQGSMNAAQLLKAELDADIFVHPSHIDNSPNSVCEAMLIGMPVIATCTGGTGSLLTDGEEGILIQDGDPHSLAGVLMELVKDPAYAAELGKNARERAIKRHDPDQITDNLINIYTSLIKKSSPSALLEKTL
jgi:glycosyltransferase involved in cell wall biosynthesis